MADNDPAREAMKWQRRAVGYKRERDALREGLEALAEGRLHIHASEVRALLTSSPAEDAPAPVVTPSTEGSS